MAASIGRGAQFHTFAQQWSAAIEERLCEALPAFDQIDDPDWERAIRSAVLYGGKRVRPLLTISGWQLGGGRSTETLSAALNVAAAAEFIHCSSLIFDDLPCMDNAKMRRGGKTLHLEFGEDKAILVALGLLLRGIELAMAAGHMAASPDQFKILHEQMMNCIGPTGLICGQWIDLSVKQSCAASQADRKLAALRNLKTAPLIRFSLIGGAILGGATRAQLEALKDFADLIGDSYQLIDDMLDIAADPEYLGKDAAIDLKNDRLNGALSLKTDLSANRLHDILGKARTILYMSFPDCEARAALEAFTEYLYGRMLSGIADSKK